MKIKYIHNLEYSYEESVQLGEHRLCIKPRSHGFQRLINFNLNISPNPKILYPLLAASGEEINRITFEGYTDSLSIKAISEVCLLYTSPSPRDKRQSRMPSSA